MKLLALDRDEAVSTRGHGCPSSSESVSVRCVKRAEASVPCGSGLPLQAVCDQPVHSIAGGAPVTENYLAGGSRGSRGWPLPLRAPGPGTLS